MSALQTSSAPNTSSRSSSPEVADFAAWRVRLRGSGESDGVSVACRVRNIDARGMVVEAPAEVGRFTWLEVDLPDGSGVSALAEVLPRRDPVALAVEVRFKHLFPDHRARLLTALAANG